VAEIKPSIFNWLVKNFNSLVSLLAAQASIFWKNYFVNISLGFLFKQVSIIIFIIGFHSNIKSSKSLFPKRKPSQVGDILSFQSWHTRNSLHLTFAY